MIRLMTDTERTGPGAATQGALSQIFEIQAGWCAGSGSPFSGDLLTRATRDIETGGPVAALLSPWRTAGLRDVVDHAVPLRWLAASHDLALSGQAPDLAAAYPTRERPQGDATAAWAALSAEIVSRPDTFVAFMAHEPQTNEVGRSACLLAGFLTIVRETNLPLRLFELGASAGLNQLWDRYRYDLGSAGAWGAANSPVRLSAEWHGPPPSFPGGVTVASRAACDRKPVDLRDPVARRRLKAYVWAGQFERLDRLEAAITMALEAGARVDAEDAVLWASRAVPAPGAATVLFHSVFWQYLPPHSRAALTALIENLGDKATAQAPFAWLRMEPPGHLAPMELRLTLWPDGRERRLAVVHPHGAHVDWDPS